MLTGVHWAEEPISRVCHVVSGIQILAVQPDVMAPATVALMVAKLSLPLPLRMVRLPWMFHTSFWKRELLPSPRLSITLPAWGSPGIMTSAPEPPMYVQSPLNALSPKGAEVLLPSPARAGA